MIAGIGLAYWWWLQPPEGGRAPAPPVATAPAPPPPEPAIRHPVEKPGEDPGPLPALDESDAYVKSALADLLGPKGVLSFLRADGFIRRTVATVDNLARPHAAPRLWPVDPTRGRFSVQRRDGGTVIHPDNALRYSAFVALVESVDAARAVALYTRLYPLFQLAYEQLGFPGRYFNDRLVAVIDLLLATPEPAGPLKLELTEADGPLKDARPWVRYRFADPALEALSSGQKMLVRSGTLNERRLKAKLAELRRHLVRSAPPGG